MYRAVRGGVGGVERPSPAVACRAGRAGRWRRCTSPGRGRDRALPVEHVHGDAAGGDPRGREVQFVDCNREDLCMSFADFEAKAERHKPRAAFLVHIGGHIAFDVRADRRLLREHGIFLIEDCAHAHGASWNGRKAGDLRRRRRLLAVRDQDDLDRRGRRARLDAAPEVIEHARAFRNYGKPTYEVHGAELPHERVHRRARAGADRAAAGDRRVEERRRPRAARSARTRAGSSCPRGWSPASTSTSCSTGSSARPAASTTNRATGSWATTSSCRTPTGSRETIPAFRCITGPRRKLNA